MFLQQLKKLLLIIKLPLGGSKIWPMTYFTKQFPSFFSPCLPVFSSHRKIPRKSNTYNTVHPRRVKRTRRTFFLSPPPPPSPSLPLHSIRTRKQHRRVADDRKTFAQRGRKKPGSDVDADARPAIVKYLSRSDDHRSGHNEAWGTNILGDFARFARVMCDERERERERGEEAVTSSMSVPFDVYRAEG